MLLLVCPSPDSSENPFYFFFKNKKIVTESGKKLLKLIKIYKQV